MTGKVYIKKIKNCLFQLIKKSCNMQLKSGALHFMKRIFVLAIFIFFFSLTLHAHGYTLTDHSKIKDLSSFTIMGEIDLRTEKDISAPVKYRTLNHEGGMKVTVLEIIKKDVQNDKSGIWVYVLLTAPMWVESGDWIEKYQKFLIFLPDEMPVYDFEE